MQRLRSVALAGARVVHACRERISHASRLLRVDGRDVNARAVSRVLFGCDDAHAKRTEAEPVLFPIAVLPVVPQPAVSPWAVHRRRIARALPQLGRVTECGHHDISTVTRVLDGDARATQTERTSRRRRGLDRLACVNRRSSIGRASRQRA
jgi:hypothetical protein